MGKCYSRINQGQRKKNDLYETPYCLTRKLLEKEYFDRDCSVLEPASGNGAIVKVLQETGFKYIEYYDLNIGKYKGNFPNETDNYNYIITNPPYTLADLFVKGAKKTAIFKFAFLLKLDFLSGQKRYRDNIYSELKKVYVLNRMPDLSYPIRPDGLIEKTGMQTYAWYIWHKGYTGNPVIDWIDISDCIYKKPRKKLDQKVKR